MLKGHVFKFQTFANEAFAHFINTFLQGNMGVTKGCSLSKTNSSVTIGAGYFCVMGRLLEIVGNETISDITNTGYYQLICEIDLSQTNTTSELNQASIKLVRNANAYSSLTKEDLFNGGSLYQYEFARFKVTEQGIIDFTDRRTFLNLTSLYSQINSNFNTLFNAKDQEAEALLEEIRQELANVIDGSVYLLKEGGTMSGDINMQGNKIIFSSNGGVEGNVTGNCSGSSGSCTGNAGTATKLKNARTIAISGGATGTATSFDGSGNISIPVTSLDASKLSGTASVATTGNAGSATKLKDARTINGTSFNGTANITTSKWGTARTLALSGAVSGSASVDGSGNVTINTSQANIAVLTGTQTLTANTNENVQNNNAMATNWKLNFPTGYNANNCVCIAFGSKFYSDAGYSYELDSAISTQMLTGATYKSITLGAKGDTNKISCYAWNWATSARDFMYKIVLMKIS